MDGKSDSGRSRSGLEARQMNCRFRGEPVGPEQKLGPRRRQTLEDRSHRWSRLHPLCRPAGPLLERVMQPRVLTNPASHLPGLRACSVLKRRAEQHCALSFGSTLPRESASWMETSALGGFRNRLTPIGWIGFHSTDRRGGSRMDHCSLRCESAFVSIAPRFSTSRWHQKVCACSLAPDRGTW